jgi:hypothetical protein
MLPASGNERTHPGICMARDEHRTDAHQIATSGPAVHWISTIKPGQKGALSPDKRAHKAYA